MLEFGRDQNLAEDVKARRSGEIEWRSVDSLEKEELGEQIVKGFEIVSCWGQSSV